MAHPPMFTEACLDTSFARTTERREALALLNTRLHPALQKIVAAEVASGNRVSGVGIDWPDPGSVHVTMGKHFGDRHAPAQTPRSASATTRTTGMPTTAPRKNRGIC